MDARLRNRAAIALHHLADNRAREPLLQAILTEKNENHRGTLVWALVTTGRETTLNRGEWVS